MTRLIKQEASSLFVFKQTVVNSLKQKIYGQQDQTDEPAIGSFIHANDEYKALCNEMVLFNQRLIVFVARKHLSHGLPLPDLIQEGNIGLMTAVERFDVNLGYKFSTYAHWWIDQAMMRAIGDKAHTIRTPVHVGEDTRKVRRIYRTLTAQMGREPELKVVAAEMKIKEDKVKDILAWGQDTISLSSPVGENGESELGGQLKDKSAPNPFDLTTLEILKENVADALAQLSPVEEWIIRARFGMGHIEPQFKEARRPVSGSKLKAYDDFFLEARTKIRELEKTDPNSPLICRKEHTYRSAGDLFFVSHTAIDFIERGVLEKLKRKAKYSSSPIQNYAPPEVNAPQP